MVDNNNNNSRDYDLSDVEKDLAYIKDKLGDLYLTVYGRRDIAKPQGLIHAVGKNTSFRENATKVNWIVFTQITIIVIYLLYNALG